MTVLWWVALGVVVIAHAAFLAYVVTGGFLAWRWPRSLVAHLAVVGWALTAIARPVTCPLTVAENELRPLVGEPPLPSGFIDHYIEGVLYPEHLTPLVRTLLATAIAASWLGLARRHRKLLHSHQ